MKRELIITVCLLLTLFVSQAVAQGRQDFSISRSLGPYCSDPQIAVNTASGDVLVAFEKTDITDSSKKPEIYIVRCARQKNGIFKPRKAYRLSQEGYNVFDQHVAYNPEDNSYMAVWTSVLNEIYVQRITGKGKPSGAINNLTGNDYTEYAPAISYAPAPAASPVDGGGRFLVLFRRIWQESGGDREALFGVFVDRNGRPVGGGAFQIKEDTGDFNFLPFVLKPALDGGYFAAGSRYFNNYGSVAAHVAKLDGAGNLVANIDLATNGTSPRVVQLKQNVIVGSWLNLGTPYNTYYRKMNADLKLSKKSYQVDKNSATSFCDSVKLQKDPGAYYVFTSGGYIMGRYMNSAGKFKQPSVKLLPLYKVTIDLFAECLPGSNRIFVAYSLRDGDTAEVRGFVVDAK